MVDVTRDYDEDLKDEIKNKNFSRIPLYYGEKDRNLIVGILITKSLIGVSADGS